MSFTRRTFLRAGAGLAAAGAVLPWPLAAAASTRDGTANWDQLRGMLTGQLVLPSDSGYPQATQLNSQQFDGSTPAGIAYCATVADVSTCVKFAGDNGIRAVARSGGHSTAGWSTVDGGLVVDVSRLNQVDVADDVLRIGGGAQSVDVLNVAAQHGLQAVSGLCPTVGVGGYLQGGGTGYQARKFGLGCDRVLGADLVLADGSVVHAAPDSHPDLYWAIRGGGGGNFGIVTGYQVRSIDAPTQTNFGLTWDYAVAAEVIAAWQHWLAAAPDELAATVGTRPSMPGGPSIAFVDGAFLGAQVDADALLDELVAAVGTAPTSRSATAYPYQQAMMQLYGCGSLTVDQCHRDGYSPAAELSRPVFYATRNVYYAEPLTGSAIAAALGAYEANPTDGQYRFFSLFALGGQVNVPARTDTAYVHRDALGFLSYTCNLFNPGPTPEAEAAARQWVDHGYAAVLPYSNGESYQNFVDPSLTDWQYAYYAENYPRLRAVKAAYDPGDFFSYPQSIR